MTVHYEDIHLSEPAFGKRNVPLAFYFPVVCLLSPIGLLKTSSAAFIRAPLSLQGIVGHLRETLNQFRMVKYYFETLGNYFENFMVTC